LVDALKSAGIDIPVSCEAGVCGTCLIGVLEGVPDHRDLYLTADEKTRGDLILPCCSRAKTPQLVLDL
jgi:vanillate O-demethylase ferredoxin subunit